MSDEDKSVGTDKRASFLRDGINYHSDIFSGTSPLGFQLHRAR